MSAFLPEAGMVSKGIETSPLFAMTDTVSRMFSPYMYGPFYDNPLRRIAERFHYDAVCAEDGPAFFVCATNVRTGKICVFTGKHITTESLLASACLPTMFQAVEVVGGFSREAQRVH
jgi:NTE family protein